MALVLKTVIDSKDALAELRKLERAAEGVSDKQSKKAKRTPVDRDSEALNRSLGRTEKAANKAANALFKVRFKPDTKGTAGFNKDLQNSSVASDKLASSMARVKMPPHASDGVKGIGEAAQNTQGKVSGLASSLVIAATAATAIGAVTFSTRLLDQFTGMENRLKVIYDSIDATKQGLQDVRDIAISTRSSLTSISDLYAKIAVSVSPLGRTQREVALATQTIAQAVSISGSSIHQQQAAIEQLSQALGSNTFAGDELKSVTENALALAQVIANGMGVSITMLKSLGAAGALNTERVFNAILSQHGKVSQQVGKMEITYESAFDNILTAAKILGAEIPKVISIVLPASKINEFAVGIYSIALNWRSMMIQLRVALIPFLNVVEDLFSLIRGGLNLIIDGVGSRLPAIFASVASGVDSMVSRLTITIGSLASSLGASLPKLDILSFIPGIDEALAMIKNFTETAENAFRWLYDRVIGHSWIPDLVLGILKWASFLVSKPMLLFTGFTLIITNNFYNAMKKIGDAWDALVDKLSEGSVLRTAADKINRVFNRIYNSLFANRLGDSKLGHDLKQILSIPERKDFQRYSETRYTTGKTEDFYYLANKAPSGRYPYVGRGPQATREVRPLGHDLINAFSNETRVRLVQFFTGILVAATLAVANSSLPVQAIVGVATSIGAVNLQPLFGQQVLSDAAGNFVNAVRKGFLRITDQLFPGFDPAGALSIVAKLMLLLASTRAVLAKYATNAFVSGTTAGKAITANLDIGAYKAQRGTYEFGRGIQEARLAKITKQVSGLMANASAVSGLNQQAFAGLVRSVRNNTLPGNSPQNITQAAGLIAKADALKTSDSVKSLNRSLNNFNGMIGALDQRITTRSNELAERRNANRTAVISAGAGLGGVLGAIASFKVGEAIAEQMVGYTEWAKVGAQLFSFVVLQGIGATIGGAVALSVVKAFGLVTAALSVPLVAVTAAIVGAVVVGKYLYDNWDSLGPKIEAVLNTFLSEFGDTKISISDFSLKAISDNFDNFKWREFGASLAEGFHEWLKANSDIYKGVSDFIGKGTKKLTTSDLVGYQLKDFYDKRTAQGKPPTGAEIYAERQRLEAEAEKLNPIQLEGKVRHYTKEDDTFLGFKPIRQLRSQAEMQALLQDNSRKKLADEFLRVSLGNYSDIPDKAGNRPNIIQISAERERLLRAQEALTDEQLASQIEVAKHIRDVNTRLLISLGKFDEEIASFSSADRTKAFNLARDDLSKSLNDRKRFPIGSLSIPPNEDSLLGKLGLPDLQQIREVNRGITALREASKGFPKKKSFIPKLISEAGAAELDGASGVSVVSPLSNSQASIRKFDTADMGEDTLSRSQASIRRIDEEISSSLSLMNSEVRDNIANIAEPLSSSQASLRKADAGFVASIESMTAASITYAEAIKAALSDQGGYVAKMNAFGAALPEAARLQAFSDFIGRAEGTTKYGYATNFGNTPIDDLSKHPNRPMEFAHDFKKGQYVRSSTLSPEQFQAAKDARLVTSAAGKLQFIRDTWDRLQKKLDLPDFEGPSQELAFAEILRERGALGKVNEGQFGDAVKLLPQEWASLPKGDSASVWKKAFNTLIDVGPSVTVPITNAAASEASMSKDASKGVARSRGSKPSTAEGDQATQGEQDFFTRMLNKTVGAAREFIEDPAAYVKKIASGFMSSARSTKPSDLVASAESADELLGVINKLLESSNLEKFSKAEFEKLKPEEMKELTGMLDQLAELNEARGFLAKELAKSATGDIGKKIRKLTRTKKEETVKKPFMGPDSKELGTEFARDAKNSFIKGAVDVFKGEVSPIDFISKEFQAFSDRLIEALIKGFTDTFLQKLFDAGGEQVALANALGKKGGEYLNELLGRTPEAVPTPDIRRPGRAPSTTSLNILGDSALSLGVPPVGDSKALDNIVTTLKEEGSLNRIAVDSAAATSSTSIIDAVVNGASALKDALFGMISKLVTGLGNLLSGLIGSGGSGGGGLGGLVSSFFDLFKGDSASPLPNSTPISFLEPFADGGVIPGLTGSPRPVLAHGGEIVLNAAQQDNVANAMKGASTGSSTEQTFNINVTGDVSRQTRAVIMQMIPMIAAGVNAQNTQRGFR